MCIRDSANFVLMGAGSLALGLVIVSAHPGTLIGNPSLAERITHVLYGLLGLDGPVYYQGTTSWTVTSSLGALGLLTAVTTLYLALRPEHPAARRTEEDETRLRALLAKHGHRDSFCHPALRRDKAVVFSPSGKAAVTYRVVSGVMLANGDPIGDMEAWPGAMERFMDVAKARSWTPAVTGCSATGGEVWTRETGLDALRPGDEAVVAVGDFSLAGRAMRNARQTAKRIERAGYRTRVRRVRDLGAAEPERIHRAALRTEGIAVASHSPFRALCAAAPHPHAPAPARRRTPPSARRNPDRPGRKPPTPRPRGFRPGRSTSGDASADPATGARNPPCDRPRPALGLR